MSIERFNGRSFDFAIGDTDVAANKFTLDITDNTAAVKRRGLPGGWVKGDVEGKGTIELDITEAQKIISKAKSAGSFQDLETFNIVVTAETSTGKHTVKVYGVKLTMTKILDVDTSSTDETLKTFEFIVTAPEFVEIDGVPYAKLKQGK